MFAFIHLFCFVFGRFRCPHIVTRNDACWRADVKVSFPSVSYHKQTSYNESNEINGFHCFGNLVLATIFLLSFFPLGLCLRAHVSSSNFYLLPLLPTKCSFLFVCQIGDFFFSSNGHQFQYMRGHERRYYRKLNRSVWIWRGKLSIAGMG